MPRKSEDEAPHPLDIALGVRVRQRRKELGFSQSDLGQAVGITFQQMQKYEHGTTRISFQRLVGIARALNCSVADLIGDLDKKKPTGAFTRQMSQLAEPGASELLAAYSSMDSSKRRRAVLSLARQLASEA